MSNARLIKRGLTSSWRPKIACTFRLNSIISLFKCPLKHGTVWRGIVNKTEIHKLHLPIPFPLFSPSFWGLVIFLPFHVEFSNKYDFGFRKCWGGNLEFRCCIETQCEQILKKVVVFSSRMDGCQVMKASFCKTLNRFFLLDKKQYTNVFAFAVFFVKVDVWSTVRRLVGRLIVWWTWPLFFSKASSLRAWFWWNFYFMNKQVKRLIFNAIKKYTFLKPFLHQSKANMTHGIFLA